MTELERFQQLIRELLQVEYSDLDFGLYRLLRLKRDEVEAFLTKQLPEEVDRAFASVADSELSELKRQVEELAARLRDEVNEGILAQDGSVVAERAKGLGKKDKALVDRYAELRGKLVSSEATVADKAEVFNHLYNFFSRYYEDGDFIPKRRYGARESYAVPWDGSETMFYWANKDQHYVKTAETLKDYCFTLKGDLASEAEWRVRFVLAEASVPKDNVKGEDRFFFPRPDAIECGPDKLECRIPFEYRPPTKQEIISYRKAETGRKPDQEKVLLDKLPALLKKVPDPELRRRLSADTRTEEQISEGKPAEPVPLLLKRLRHFVKRSTTDYFVHKNLRRFLQEELEFYIKDQVLHLGDIEGDLSARLRMLKVLRRLAGQIIEFLSQIEDAQKKLFEKKKFVTETSWLIPIQNVPEKFWPDIVANKAQRAQWKDWLAIEPDEFFGKKGKIDLSYLKGHPTLVVDTRLFPADWTRALLESLPFADLDDATDGLLVHSENYHALRLLQERYREQVKCVYIDPPFNTGKGDFLYKDRYQHSSWAAMQAGRLALLAEALADSGYAVVSIGEQELVQLRLLMERIFGPENFVATVVWNTEGNIDNQSKIKGNHEYLLLFARRERAFEHPAVIDPNIPRESKLYNDTIANSITKNGPANPPSPVELPRGFPCDFETGIVRPGDTEWPRLSRAVRVRESKTTSSVTATSGWSSRELLDDFIANGCRPIRDSNGNKTWFALTSTGAIYGYKTRPANPSHVLSVVRNVGTVKQMAGMLGDMGFVFEYPKPLKLLEYVNHWSNDRCGTHQDCFAGSGSTGHAVINLNREDGGQRKFILVEMGDHFDTVMAPRVVKVMYTPEWKDGKPKRLASKEEAERTPRLVKVLRLESYEDALHNVASDGTKKRAEKREKAHKAAVGDEQYRIKYLVSLPLEASDTVLNLEKLEHPFSYALEILSDDGPKQKPADLVETFNYLYGLRVQRHETWRDGDREYRVVKATDREQKQRILVVWRDMAGLKPAQEREFLEGRLKELASAGEAYDEKFINGGCAVPGIKSLDPLFKRLMTAGGEESG